MSIWAKKMPGRNFNEQYFQHPITMNSALRIAVLTSFFCLWIKEALSFIILIPFIFLQIHRDIHMKRAHKSLNTSCEIGCRGECRQFPPWIFLYRCFSRGEFLVFRQAKAYSWIESLIPYFNFDQNEDFLYFQLVILLVI